jgi:hypothetical protein
MLLSFSGDRFVRFLISAAVLGLLASSAAYADPAMTAAPTRMRAGPTPHSAVVQEVPAHAQIDVSECGKDWCSASWRDVSGFVAVRDITENDAPLAHAAPPHPVVVAPFFGWGYGWRHRYYY